jgi:hypothetical protein
MMSQLYKDEPTHTNIQLKARSGMHAIIHIYIYLYVMQFKLKASWHQYFIIYIFETDVWVYMPYISALFFIYIKMLFWLRFFSFNYLCLLYIPDLTYTHLSPNKLCDLVYTKYFHLSSYWIYTEAILLPIRPLVCLYYIFIRHKLRHACFLSSEITTRKEYIIK